VFTITTNAIPSGTTPSITSITPSITTAIPAANITQSNTCNAAGIVLSNGGNTATCTLTVNSTVAGTVTANATSVWHFVDNDANANPASTNVTRSTDSTHGSSGSVTKRFVDANISISPNGVNEISNQHVFTITTNAIPSGTTPSITSITPSITTAIPAANITQSNTCDAQGIVLSNNGNTATCTLTVNSTVAGTVTANATSVWHFVDGDANANPASVNVTRTTDSTHGSSGSVVKRFVDANISISPNGVNEVNHQHVFTITTNAIPSGTTPSITSITPSITTAIPAANITQSNTCDAQGIVLSNNGNTATCTLTVNSSVAGVITANATSVWHFVDGDANANPASVNVTRTTDSTHSSSGPATKRFVDAYITIGPAEATNSVGEPHTFVVNVFQNDGLPAGAPGDNVTGFGPAPDHTVVAVTFTNQNGATWQTTLDTCASPNGTSGGSCTVTGSSPTAGDVIAHAVVTFDVGTVSLTRATDGTGNNSGDAIKHFIAASVSWTKVDNAGQPLGGATFQLCRTHDWDIANNMPFIAPLNPPVCQSVTDNDSSDLDKTNGHFTVGGLPLGTYTVHETQAPPGYELDPSTKEINVSPDNPSAVIGTAFVDSRPIVKITGFGYTNAPSGATQFNGIFVGTTTYSVNLHNYGTATAHLTNSSLAVSSNAACSPSNTKDLSGIDILAGQDGPSISLTCTYDHPNPKAITATLTVNYTTNGFEYHASGSPASITFTVDPNNP
jgi:Prealbumin-like fold domain